MATDFNFDRVLQNFNRLKKTMPVKVANATKNYFIKSFTDQSFDGQAWQEVQRRISGTNANKYAKPASKTRAILIQSGKLRRAVSTSLRLATFDKIEFLIDGGTIPYAKVHNDGGVIDRTESFRASFFKTKVTQYIGLKQSKKSGKFYMAKKVKTIELRGEDISVKAHRITMPKRRFIGDTKELRKKQFDIIVKEIDNIWK